MSKPQKFRKRPIAVEAMRYTAETCRAIHEWIGLEHGEDSSPCGVLGIDIPGAWSEAEPGDWVLRGAEGFYSCAPSIFAKLYEAVEL